MQQIISPTMTNWIKGLRDSSDHPIWRGRALKSRKVCEVGEAYYWKCFDPNNSEDDITLAMCLKMSLQVPLDYNSILFNFYNDAKGISYHTDQTTNLEPGTKVYSVSFTLDYLEGKTADGVLGHMYFKEADGTVAKTTIDNLRVLSFDPFEHEADGVQHKATTRKGVERINITFRKVCK